ncbi:MAG: hypothetical protein PUC65_08315 [Clostridiales bacterium]|nr:hypothetical protein [Clostridiales bacterium]
MEKIVLKDGTEINITGATSNSVTIPYNAETFMETYKLFTTENLEEYIIETETDAVMAIVKDKKVKSVMIEEDTVIIMLADVNLTEKKLTEMEQSMELIQESIDFLIMQ